MRLASLPLLFALSAVGQVQMPPGTTSPVPGKEAVRGDDLQRIEALIADGKFAEATAALKPMATPQQKNARVFYDLAFAEDAQGHDDNAAEAYRADLQIAPNDVAARVSLGLLLARSGKTEGAADQLNIAAGTPGIDDALAGRAHRALAEIHLSSKPQQARADLLAALKVSKETTADAAMAAEIAEKLHDDAATETAFAHAYERDPASVEVATNYARVLQRAGKSDAAARVLADALKAHPANRALLMETAAEDLLQGHADSALPGLLQLHAAEPENTAVTLLLARAYVTTGAYDRADPLYQRLLEKRPDDATLLSEAADSLIRQRQSPRAQPMLQRALAHPEQFPTPTAMAQAAGELAFAASSNKDAETALKAVALRGTVLPPDAPFTFISASAHDTLHQTQMAVEQYQLFLRQSNGKYADQEWQAQQRLLILNRRK